MKEIQMLIALVVIKLFLTSLLEQAGEITFGLGTEVLTKADEAGKRLK